MHTWIDRAEAKVVALDKELADLRQRYAIATKSSCVALESLRMVTSRATDAAKRAGSAAAKSVVAARQVVIATIDPASQRLLISAEEAEIAADTAAQAAREAAELIPAVLQAARTVGASQADATTIHDSMTSVLIALRAAEAAAAAHRLAQSVTSYAGSIALIGH